MRDKTIGELMEDAKNINLNTLLYTRISNVYFWMMMLVVSFIWLMGAAIAHAVTMFLFCGFLVALSLGAVLLLGLFFDGVENTRYHQHDHYVHHVTETPVEPAQQTQRMIEQQPTYHVVDVPKRMIEQRSDRVRLPQQRQSLPVERKRLEARR